MNPNPHTHIGNVAFCSIQTSTLTLSVCSVCSYTYETLQTIADHLLSRTELRPKIGIICGSGLGSLADQLTDTNSFPYESIPNFPISTVEGHAGQMIFGLLGGVPVMCMQGRFHYYEGYPLAKVGVVAI